MGPGLRGHVHVVAPDASCFSYSLSVKKKKSVIVQGVGHREVSGRVLRVGDNHSEHGQSNEAMRFTEHLGVRWLAPTQLLWTLQINLKILNQRKYF